MPSLPGGEELCLVRAAAGRRRPDRGDARRVDHALDPGPQALLEQVARADRRSPRRAARRPPAAATSSRRSGRRGRRPCSARLTCAAVEQVALDGSYSSPARFSVLRRVADRQPQVVAALGQRARDVRADEAGSPGDQRLPHRGRVYEGVPACSDGPLAVETARGARQGAQAAARDLLAAFERTRGSTGSRSVAGRRGRSSGGSATGRRRRRTAALAQVVRAGLQEPLELVLVAVFHSSPAQESTAGSRVGCARHAADRRRHGLDRLSPAGAGGAGTRSAIVSLYVNFGGDRTERETDLMDDLDTLLRRDPLGRAVADDLAAVGRRLRRGLRAAAGGRPRRGVDPHLRGHLGHVRLGPPGGRAAREGRQGRRARPRRRLAERGRRDGPDRARRRARGPAAASTRTGSQRAPRRCASRSRCGSRSTRSSS